MNIVDYYSKLLPVELNRSINNNSKSQRTNKYKKENTKKDFVVFETLEDIADYQIQCQEDVKFLFCQKQGISLGCVTHLFIPYTNLISNVHNKYIIHLFNYIEYINLIGPKRNYKTKGISFMSNAIDDAHISLRLKYIRIYKLHSNAINKCNQLLSDFISIFSSRSKNKNYKINFFENKLNLIFYNLIQRLTLYFDIDCSLLGVDSINKLEKANNLGALSIMNFKHLEGLLGLKGEYIGFGLGYGYRIKVFDKISDLLSIIEQITNNKFIRNSLYLVQSINIFNLDLKNIEFVFGNRIFMSFKPWLNEMDTDLISIETIKDFFINFYYGFAFNITSSVVCELRWGLGILNLQKMILRYIVSNEDIEYTRDTPRICQGPVRFRNSLSTFSIYFYIFI